METVTDFIFLGSKVTVDSGWSHKIKRRLLLENAQPRQHVKKQRHHFAGKGPYSQSSGFTVAINGCESWTIKQAEHQRIDAFELWCQRRLLGVPWIARSSNQSILKEIIPQYSLEGLMLKFKLQYFGHLIHRTDSGKDPDAEKD